MKSRLAQRLRFEPRDLLLSSVILLVACGVVMIFSAGAFHATVYGDPYYYLKKHLTWLPIGVLAACFFYLVDYRALQRWALGVLFLVAVLLAMVFVPGVGEERNGAFRWITFGTSMNFQPSEAAKFAVVLLVAAILSNSPGRARRFWSGFVPLCFLVLLPFALILVEPDFGTAAFVLAVGFGTMLIGGVRFRYMLVCALLLAPPLYFYVQYRWDTIVTRVLAFLRPEESYQVFHSLVALGSGGMAGKGLGAGAQKLDYLPEVQTDFILSNLGEELGFLGSGTIVFLFVMLLWGGVGIAWRSSDRFGLLLGAGVTMAISFQAVLNIAVVTASMPTKGIPLPFLTFGGSGLCMTLAQVGVLLSIDRVQRELEASAEAPVTGGRPPTPATAVAATEDVS